MWQVCYNFLALKGKIMENQLWLACKEKDFETFKNLLADNNTQVNTTNRDGIRLFNQITKSALRNELPKEFFYEMLKRKDLDINFSDEKNIPAIYEFSDFKYSVYFFSELEPEEKTRMKALRDEMAKALLERDDLDVKAEVFFKDGEDCLKWLNPIGPSIRSHQPSLAHVFISSGKFDLNSPVYESGIIPSFGPNKNIFIKHDEVLPIDYASSLLNLDIVSDLLDYGAKSTSTALFTLQKESRIDEDFFYNEKANAIIKAMSDSLDK